MRSFRELDASWKEYLLRIPCLRNVLYRGQTQYCSNRSFSRYLVSSSKFRSLLFRNHQISWHSAETSLVCKHSRGVFFDLRQQSLWSKQRFRSTRSPSQGLVPEISPFSSDISLTSAKVFTYFTFSYIGVFIKITCRHYTHNIINFQNQLEMLILILSRILILILTLI